MYRYGRLKQEATAQKDGSQRYLDLRKKMEEDQISFDIQGELL
jgi:hypothetical protein